MDEEVGSRRPARFIGAGFGALRSGRLVARGGGALRSSGPTVTLNAIAGKGPRVNLRAVASRAAAAGRAGCMRPQNNARRARLTARAGTCAGTTRGA